jgi:hypothetical protein
LGPAYGVKAVPSIFDGPPGRRSGGYGAPDSDDDDFDEQGNGYMEDEDVYYGEEEEVVGVEVQRVSDLRAYGQECRVSELKRLDRREIAKLEAAEEEAEELAEEGEEDGTRWVEKLQQTAVSREKELERQAEADMYVLMKDSKRVTYANAFGDLCKQGK